MAPDSLLPGLLTDRVSDVQEGECDRSEAVAGRVGLVLRSACFMGCLYCEVPVMVHTCSSRRCETTYNTVRRQGASERPVAASSSIWVNGFQDHRVGKLIVPTKQDRIDRVLRIAGLVRQRSRRPAP